MNAPTTITTTAAARVLARARDELAGVARAVREQPFLDDVEAGRAPEVEA